MSRARCWCTAGFRPGVLALLGVLACGAAPRPSDAEIHRMVAEAVRDHVNAPSPLLLHPFLIQRGEGGALALEHSHFNAFDPNSVPEVVELGGAKLELCAMTAAGSCEVPDGRVAVALSELQELGQDGVGVGAVVVDEREGREGQSYFVVRVNARSGGWAVVEVRRAE